MNHPVQVDKSHYTFDKYISQTRWASLWHQLDEIIKLDPGAILEIGPGTGVFSTLGKLFGLQISTLDISRELKPDYVGSVTELPFPNCAFDTTCAFQVLEHVPYETALEGFAELARIARKNIVISLPDAKKMWPYGIYLPRIGYRQYLIPHPFQRPQEHTYDGEHYWEVNKKGYKLDKVLYDFGKLAKLTRTYRVKGNPYHRFFMFESFSD